MTSAHTNVLLLHQIFRQAQKWHLDLDADLADLENRDLLDQVKRWEDSECISMVEESKPLVQKKLAPLNEGGPMQLLKIQIGNVQLFVNLIFILYARWRFKIACLQTFVIRKKNYFLQISNFNFP